MISELTSFSLLETSAYTLDEIFFQPCDSTDCRTRGAVGETVYDRITPSISGELQSSLLQGF